MAYNPEKKVADALTSLNSIDSGHSYRENSFSLGDSKQMPKPFKFSAPTGSQNNSRPPSKKGKSYTQPKNRNVNNNDYTETETPSKEDSHITILQSRYSILYKTIDELVDEVEKSVIGQHESIKKLTFLVYHNQYLNLLEDLNGTNFKHLSGLIIGPTGSGKTASINKIASLFNVPFVKVAATDLTSSGYVGQEVNSILLSLLRAADNDIELAERGIVFIDEIDKKQATSPNNSSNRDINGTAVQEELLKIFEPSTVYLGRESIPFNTSRLTVIGGGRFKGLEEIREKRLNGPKVIGFNDQSPVKNEDNPVLDRLFNPADYCAQDLIDFGLIDELVGRIKIIAEFKKLSLFDAIAILFSKDSLLVQYIDIFKSRAVYLDIDPIILTEIAETLSNSPTGVRDLESKVFTLLYPALYDTEQSYFPGICNIDSEGNYSSVFDENGFAKYSEGQK